MSAIFFVQKTEISVGQSFCVPMLLQEYFGSCYIPTVVANKNSLSISCVLTIFTFFKK